MNIVHVRVVPVRLTLTHALETGHGRIMDRSGAVITLTEASGVTGSGEALPLPGFGLESPEHAQRTLESCAAALVGEHFRDLDAALAASVPLTKDAPTARSAVDAAFHDLAAQAAGVDLAAFFDETRRSHVAVSALVAGTDTEALVTAARSAVGRGFDTLKLKVGWSELANDVERLAAVRAAVGPGPRIRLDANGAWKESEARTALEEFATYDLEFVEQPVPATQIDALARLRAAAPVRVAADEAVGNEASAAHLLDAGAADVLVLKPAVLGGLRAAWRTADRAKSAKVDVVVTSFLDSSLGIAAALHLAAALPASPFATGLATGTWLREDLCTPLVPRDGSIALPSGTGLGVRPDPAALHRCARGVPREYAA